MMFRFVCVCLLLSEVSGQRGSGVPYSFGFYNFDNRPSGSGSVPSVNDLGEVKVKLPLSLPHRHFSMMLRLSKLWRPFLTEKEVCPLPPPVLCPGLPTWLHM
ncbi:hypothetical protein AALO_G00242730 [Alosa alosa]|uniref:Secreted protein n=1 Tax=Alosa alosa TaxID=278164 RepID=A0AAV6FW91_9TELE|nr:hypothetical protein AALO_G00242730 [Alosa alosa]